MKHIRELLQYHYSDQFASAAMEPRQITRWEAARFARSAYELGVRVIGGCCGFESHHVRAMAEELQAERGGRVAEGSKKHDKWGAMLVNHTKPFVRTRSGVKTVYRVTHEVGLILIWNVLVDSRKLQEWPLRRGANSQN